MGLKLLTLNIEGSRHLDRVVACVAHHRPDVVCVQELFETDVDRLAALGPYSVSYAVSVRMPANMRERSGPLRNWGIALLSRWPLRAWSSHYYVEDPAIRDFREPNDARSAVIVADLSHDGADYRIATTHFTWSDEGEASDLQRSDFGRLAALMARYPHYVLCGDFNAPRGREMFARFQTELGLRDHLPAGVTTTLDARWHRAGPLELVVDTVFSRGGYRVHDVQVIEGVSDHKAILATVEAPGQNSGLTSAIAGRNR